MKSSKNKTIDISLENNRENYEKCIQVSENAELKNITNKTIIGDAMETLPLLPKKFVDLLIVDPPYNLTKNYHGNKFSKRNTEEYYQFTEKWVNKVLPILKDEATIYVCCDWASSQIIFDVLNKYFHIQNRITWQREKGRGAKTNWKNGMEDIWFATVSKKYYFDVDSVKRRKTVIAPYKKEGKPKDWVESEDGNFRDTHPSNLWDDITIPYWSMKENTQHPTQKPEKLVAKLILASTQKGDFVFDPFLGSGTTSVVAKKLGRNFSGIEMNPLYASWTELRLSKTFYGDEIQGYSQGVFWNRNSLSQQKKETPND